MRAVRSTGEGGVEVVDMPDPDPSGPDGPGGPREVVAITSASICGSDFNFVKGGSRFVIGHELAGITGDGRAVAVEAIFGCRQESCDQCRSGNYNRCPTMGERVPGFTMDGGMAEHFAVPEVSLVDLPDGVAPADGSLVETMAVGWHGARMGGVSPGRTVAAVGGGAVGLVSLVSALAQGAERVDLVARHPHQKEAGERLGARIGTSGQYDVVFEAAGTESALATAVELAAPGGTVVVLGMFGAVLPVPYLPAFLKEVRVVGSMAYCRDHGDAEGRRDVDHAAALLAARPEIAEALVTHRFPLEDAAEAFRVAADKASGAIKVVVEP